MIELQSKATPGFFGKLPSVGDFVQRSLDSSLITAWDHWLSRHMQQQAASMDETRWHELYWSMPYWRFVLPSMLHGGQMHIGVVAPSADRVGRRYPMMFALPLSVNELAPEILSDCEVWFESAEALMQTALDPNSNFDPDTLDFQLNSELPALMQDHEQVLPLGRVSTAQSACCAELQPASAALITASWTSQIAPSLSHGNTAASLWWSLAANADQSRLLAFGGWPDFEGFGRLLRSPAQQEDAQNSIEEYPQEEPVDELSQTPPTGIPIADTQARLKQFMSSAENETNIIPIGDDLLDDFPMSESTAASTSEFEDSDTALSDDDELTRQLPISDSLAIGTPRIPITWESAGLSDVGCQRSVNQDSISVQQDRGLWVVADGMGGHSDGAYASQMICERLEQTPLGTDHLENVQAIEQTINEVHQHLIEEAQRRDVDIIGSTVVLALATPTHWLVGWVGDSRLYSQATDGKVRQITRDHNQVDQGFEDGMDIEDMPQAGSGLTRAVGVLNDSGRVLMEWKLIDRQIYSTLMICCDGIPDAITATEIHTMLASANSAHSMTQSCIDAAKNNHCSDNVSAITIRSCD